MQKKLLLAALALGLSVEAMEQGQTEKNEIGKKWRSS